MASGNTTQLRGCLAQVINGKKYEANCTYCTFHFGMGTYARTRSLTMSHRKYKGGFRDVQNTIYSKGRGEHRYVLQVPIPKIHLKSCVKIIGNL